MHAISSAYHNLMPPACYPFALVFLECDYEEVDVNVHPSKTEVRFRHSSFVHDFVRDSIREVLIESRPVSSLPAPAEVTLDRGEQPAAALPFSEFTQRIENQPWPDVPSAVAPVPEPGAAEQFAGVHTAGSATGRARASWRRPSRSGCRTLIRDFPRMPCPKRR